METQDPIPPPADIAAVKKPMIKLIVALVVSAILGVLGYALLLSIGRYGPMLPAALPGLGVNVVSDRRSYMNGMLATVVGLGTAIFAEWKYRPFVTDDSLGFFLSNLTELSTPTLVMFGLGAAAAFFLGTSFFKPARG